METETNTESENGTVQDTETQNDQNEQSKDTKPITNFLEFGEMKNGEHSIALVKEPGEERATVAARIYTEFPGDGKRPTYTAKDKDGNILFPPTEKLWELKKDIKEQARPLLEKARLAKTTPVIGKPEQKKEEPIIEKEAKAVGNKLADEGKEFGGAAKDIVLGTGREHEIKNIRQNKAQKSKGLQR